MLADRYTEMLITTLHSNTMGEVTRSHPQMVGDVACWPIKNSFCVFLARVKTYTYTKN